MTDPYFIEGPALISFSGGRTSAFMLKHILDAHRGTLPADVHVVFANTGKEREETLRFVHECGSRWNVHVHWVEWRGRSGSSAERFEEVGYNSASRDGEPFAALLRVKKYLPNPVTRFCTAELKIEAMKNFMLSLGYEHWNNIVGLRADEMRRVIKQTKRNDEGKERWRSIMPLFKATVTKRHVWTFWLGNNLDPKALVYPLPQGFDLGLYPYEGNCDGCFLKGWEVLSYQHRERPGYLDWWGDQQVIVADLGAKPNGATWHKEFSHATIARQTDASPLLIERDWRSLEFDAECGVGGVDPQIRCGARDDGR